ncbi:hypothetical protein [Planococcus soli]|uniref:hypothetical protein n=1 Tax=Planococcus soli TaxID=2666072 RepID=UPI00115CF0EE|nr:hypothetical protein [Planococcus soli]
MVSVTTRIGKVKQPRGGYINPRDLSLVELTDGIQLHPEENIHATLVGLAVDYLTRFTLGTSLEEAFAISLKGARNVRELDYAMELISGINGLDDNSIENACQLVGFDVAFRNSLAAYTPVQSIQPDYFTISNIRTMVERVIVFSKKYGPITKDGFTFEGGYNQTITTGDGDFLTETGLWDLKVSKSGPTNKHTLQLLVYYLLGLHSLHDEFDNLKELGVFNPRLNRVYVLPIKDIPSNIISAVTSEVIGN